MLWLAIHFPHLSLELFLRGEPTDDPFAVYEAQGNRHIVIARNRLAAQHGITPGQPLTTARTLCPHLQSRSRNRAAERQLLESVALWAYQYTSIIDTSPESGILLEIGGSEQLFGGMDSLWQQLEQALSEQGLHPQIAVAPSPLGSWLLACNRQSLQLRCKETLRHHLGALSIRNIGLPAEQQQALNGMGIHRVDALLALPHAALSRRLGPELLLYLDKALGLRADPRPRFTPPDHFEQKLLLSHEVENSGALVFACQRLLILLEGFLRSRQAGIQHCTLLMEHHEQPPSRLELGLLEPSRHREHLLNLFREKLATFTLPAPTHTLILKADQLLPLEREQSPLFPGQHRHTTAWTGLMEKLRHRLGERAITTLSCHADHRPELRWRPCPLNASPLRAPDPHAPLWLLKTPQPLTRRHQHLWCHGPVTLDSGPRRIESGWWDEGEVRRDYYLAHNLHGQRLWLFRERSSGDWYLHGLFG